MRLKLIAISLGISSLSACGGGSDEGSGAAATAPIPQYSSTVMNFSNGFVLSKVTDQPYRNNTRNLDAVIVTDSSEAANKAVDVLLKVNDSDPSVSITSNSPTIGDYAADAQGNLTNGESFTSVFWGSSLSSGGYVSINFLNFGAGGGSFVTDGTSPFGTTPSAATYQGSTLFTGDDANGTVVSEIGTFQMDVDFANGVADLSASSATGSLTASGIVVSDITSQINGNGLISLDNQTPSNASILGFFSGQDGEGVHGIGFAADKPDSGTSAMFMGKR